MWAQPLSVGPHIVKVTLLARDPAAPSACRSSGHAFSLVSVLGAHAGPAEVRTGDDIVWRSMMQAGDIARERACAWDLLIYLSIGWSVGRSIKERESCYYM